MAADHFVDGRKVEDLWHLECECGWRAVAAMGDESDVAEGHLADMQAMETTP